MLRISLLHPHGRRDLYDAPGGTGGSACQGLQRAQYRHCLRRGTGRAGEAGGHAHGLAEALAADSDPGAEGGFPGHHAGGGTPRPEPGPGRRRGGGTGRVDQDVPVFRRGD